MLIHVWTMGHHGTSLLQAVPSFNQTWPCDPSQLGEVALVNLARLEKTNLDGRSLEGMRPIRLGLSPLPGCQSPPGWWTNFCRGSRENLHLPQLLGGGTTQIMTLITLPVTNVEVYQKYLIQKANERFNKKSLRFFGGLCVEALVCWKSGKSKVLVLWHWGD